MNLSKIGAVTIAGAVLGVGLWAGTLGGGVGDSKDHAPQVDPAASVISTDGPGWEDRAGRAALALIDYPWRQLGWQVRFKAGRAGLKAATYPDRKLIEVYVRPGVRLIDLAHDLAHEIGHAVDWTYNTTQRRAEWKLTRGIPASAGWFTCNGCKDLNSPVGDYVETFAMYVLDRRAPFLATVKPPPTRDQVPQLERFFQP